MTANVAIADPGAIDTFGCTFEWGDGTPTTTVAATGSSCSAPHAYAAYGSYHVTVTVVDKDGGTGLDTQIVVVDGPPVVHVSDASGNEGSAIPLTATATDPEGDALTYAWTATPVSVDPGASCTFSNTGVGVVDRHVQRQRHMDDHADRERRDQSARPAVCDAHRGQRRADADDREPAARAPRRGTSCSTAWSPTPDRTTS